MKKSANSSGLSIIAGSTIVHNASDYGYLGVLMDNVLSYQQQSKKIIYEGWFKS